MQIYQQSKPHHLQNVFKYVANGQKKKIGVG